MFGVNYGPGKGTQLDFAAALGPDLFEPLVHLPESGECAL